MLKENRVDIDLFSPPEFEPHYYPTPCLRNLRFSGRQRPISMNRGDTIGSLTFPQSEQGHGTEALPITHNSFNETLSGTHDAKSQKWPEKSV